MISPLIFLASLIEKFDFPEAVGPEIFDIWHKAARPGHGAAQTWHSSLPVALHSSTWCGDRAISYLNNQTENEPFCSWISFPDPHHPFDCPTPWSTMYNLDDVDLNLIQDHECAKKKCRSEKSM